MKTFAFSENFSMFDVTPLENIFIQEYMLRAPGDYVKAYIYALMQCYHPSDDMDIETMARDLQTEPAHVSDAFRYWERLGLVRRVADNPLRIQINNLRNLQTTQTRNDDVFYKYRDFNISLQTLFGADRALSPHDLQYIYDWIEVLHLPEEVVMILLQYQISIRGKKFRMQTIEKTAQEWAKQGVRTAADAEALILLSSRQREELQRLLRYLGIRRASSTPEEQLYSKWTKDWGFSYDAIMQACAETIKGRNPSLAYLDSILQTFKSQGVNTKEGILKLQDGSARSEPARNVLYELGMRGISPNTEVKRLYTGWLEKGFSHDAIIIAARYTARKNGKIDALNKLLDDWRDKNLLTVQAAEEYIRIFDENENLLKTAFGLCGLTRKPSTADHAALARWRASWSPSNQLILYAAELAANADRKLPFLQKLLENWHGEGITTPAQAAEARAQHAGKAVQPPANGGQKPQARAGKEVGAHRYQQREYQEEDLSDIIADLSDDIEI